MEAGHRDVGVMLYAHVNFHAPAPVSNGSCFISDSSSSCVCCTVATTLPGCSSSSLSLKTQRGRLKNFQCLLLYVSLVMVMAITREETVNFVQ